MIYSNFSEKMFLSIEAHDSTEEQIITKKLNNKDLTREEKTILYKQSEKNKVQLFRDLVEYIEDDPDSDFGNINFSYDCDCIQITFSTPFMNRDTRAKYHDIGKLNFTAIFNHSKDFVNDLKAFVHCLELQDCEYSE